ncbi:MAG: hypothetical protein H8E32_16690 [Nitrospinae bacterium]|nr:hypothetical protein [Nitrospinota bacterium]
MAQTHQKNESGNWSEIDYQIGLDFVRDHEDESNTILHTEKNVSVILPGELPIFGAGFYGIFMLAPIVLFMLVISSLLVIVLTSNSLEIQTQILFLFGCLFFLWALTHALKLLFSSRDLFPRKYFSTLGLQGVSSHYSKLHFPFHSAVNIKWDEIKSTRSYSTLFLPGVFTGVFKSRIVEITSKDGEILKIPFHATEQQAPIVSQSILDLIQQKSTKG